jgi:hypothetical protein
MSHREATELAQRLLHAAAAERAGSGHRGRQVGDLPDLGPDPL